MSNVVSFRRLQQQVMRWSPLPFSDYLLVYQGTLNGAPARLVFDACSYENFSDTPTWNLFYAFHQSYKGQQQRNELLVTADNPRSPVVLCLANTKVEERRVRDWMLELSPVECVEFLTSTLDLPFPPGDMRVRALKRLSHLASAP